MAPTIKLRHTFFLGDRMFYFYDGETEVVDGVITIPANRPEWAQRAWIKGYRLNVESGEARMLDDILAECANKSAKSTKEKENARTDARGQSTSDNGLREGSEARPDRLPGSRVEGGVSDSTPDAGAAD